MFETSQEISTNKYISNLVQEASGFGMFGAYVKYTKAENPENNGIYFICGYDSKIVMDKNMNIEKIYEQMGNTRTFRSDLHITKITNQSPFNVHQDVMNYCLHASTLRAICNKYNYDKNLRYVAPTFLTHLEMYYMNSIDKTLPYIEQQRYAKMTEVFLKTEGDRQFILNGETGDGPEVHLRPEKIDKKCSNMVSLEELTYKTLGTAQAITTLDMLPKIKQGLNKHPEILYFQAKPVVAKLKLPDNQGFGSKEANVSTSVMIIYDAFYKKQMDLIFLKAKHPQCFKYSVEDIKAKSNGKGTCSFGISAADIDIIFKEAEARGIPLCIDEKKLYFNCDRNISPTENIAGYTITIPKDEIFIQQMDNVLTGEAIRARDRRILTREDEKNFSYLRKDTITLENDNMDDR